MIKIDKYDETVRVQLYKDERWPSATCLRYSDGRYWLYTRFNGSMMMLTQEQIDDLYQLIKAIKEQ